MAPLIGCGTTLFLIVSTLGCRPIAALSPGLRTRSGAAWWPWHSGQPRARARAAGVPGRKHRPYAWASARGSVGSYSKSALPAASDIANPTWIWQDLSTVPIGVAVDDENHIYATCADGIRKFSPNGTQLWYYRHKQIGAGGFERITKAAAIMDGAAYGISSSGRAFAVSMATGKELWSTFVSRSSDGNFGQVAAHDGVVIVAAEESFNTKRATASCCGPMNHRIFGVNGSSGTVLWTYEPSIPIWNFGCAFAANGTFVYQDFEGRVHRNRVRDGALLWKSGGIPGSWTDGQANLGPNGVVYGVSNYGKMGPTGCISAYNLADGAMIWRHDLPKSPNSIPAIGHLAGYEGLSVVIPVGFNDMPGERIDVHALDAETGKRRWVFRGPTQKLFVGKGDPIGFVPRLMNHGNPLTLPNSWGCPTIDGKGVVYVGGITGHFLALQDSDGNGDVGGLEEVSMLKTSADFVGSSAPAIAPGMLAVANSNALYVWRFNQSSL